ncbi:MAG: hypothetical protein R3C25_13965 [Hyphomonadaceae bacterium]
MARTATSDSFVLYLRSFAIDGKLSEIDVADLPLSGRVGNWKGVAFEASKELSFENQLFARLREARSDLVLVSVGRDFGQYGIGRVESSDHTWRDDVSELLTKASLIILVVGNTAGTMWEIKRVIELGLLKKTVFVAPPAAMLKGVSQLDQLEFERDYQSATAAIRLLGIELPQSASGLATYFADDGPVRFDILSKYERDTLANLIAMNQA